MKSLAAILAAALILASTSSVSAEDAIAKPRSVAQAKVIPASQVQPLHNSIEPGVGLIPNDRYRAYFGQGHKFHLAESNYGHDNRFRRGGYSFGFADEWPTNWLSSQDLFVVQMDGMYYLCNTAYPGVNIPLNITQ
jgi:hypothetical protein